MFEQKMFGHLPSLLSMKCLKTTGPIVSSALRVRTFQCRRCEIGLDNDFDADYEGDEKNADSNQVLNVGVHHGKTCALRVVTVLQESNCCCHLVLIICNLHGNEYVSSWANHTQHLREGRGVDLACTYLRIRQ